MIARQLVTINAQSALKRQLSLAHKSRSILSPLIGRCKHFHTWRHYPASDAIDVSGAWQFYYHAHDTTFEGGARHPNEHGHIHLFRRNGQGQLSHLTGLSLNSKGVPLTWFTTNQWVTGERWCAAKTMAKELINFELKVQGPLAGFALWLADLVSAYTEQLREMLGARDLALVSHCQRHQVSRAKAWGDRNISVWSSFPIDWPNDAITVQGRVLSLCN